MSNANTWRNYLYTPTQINKINDDYFIVDCWHHRIIYNNMRESNLSNWKMLTEDIRGGHTVASDGRVLLADDTDNNAVRVFGYIGN
ncbi:MAG: hypothetical protein IJT82_09860, partial [Schwartzia sp.]|nr:hypothetical protein [Schwartzia sp. (in: firmicutes)]